MYYCISLAELVARCPEHHSHGLNTQGAQMLIKIYNVCCFGDE